MTYAESPVSDCLVSHLILAVAERDYIGARQSDAIPIGTRQGVLVMFTLFEFTLGNREGAQICYNRVDDQIQECST